MLNNAPSPRIHMKPLPRTTSILNKQTLTNAASPCPPPPTPPTPHAAPPVQKPKDDGPRVGTAVVALMIFVVCGSRESPATSPANVSRPPLHRCSGIRHPCARPPCEATAFAFPGYTGRSNLLPGGLVHPAPVWWRNHVCALIGRPSRRVALRPKTPQTLSIFPPIRHVAHPSGLGKAAWGLVSW